MQHDLVIIGGGPGGSNPCTGESPSAGAATMMVSSAMPEASRRALAVFTQVIETPTQTDTYFVAGNISEGH